MTSTRNTIIAIAAIIIIAIAFFQIGKIIGKAIPEKATTMTYNNYEFTYMDQMWYFQWQDQNKLYNVPLRYNPEQVLNIS